MKVFIYPKNPFSAWQISEFKSDNCSKHIIHLESPASKPIRKLSAQRFEMINNHVKHRDSMFDISQ